jgi:cytidylate kinase
VKARIVAIDGPSGAGKSTVARELARRLELPYLDTGAMYRVVGLQARRAGLPLPIDDPGRVAALARHARIELTTAPGGTRVLLDGEDVTAQIRTPEISLYASAVSAVPEVRRLLVARQRELGLAGGGVVEGRDIGSRVFPETPYKFFLTAGEEERARRRHAELLARATPEPYEKVLAEMRRRDGADSSRSDSPLRCDDTYTVIDSEGLGVAEVVEAILARVRELDSPERSTVN